MLYVYVIGRMEEQKLQCGSLLQQFHPKCTDLITSVL